MLFNNAENTQLFGDLLNRFRGQDNSAFNLGNSLSDSFLVAGTNPNNKYYSLNETDALRKQFYKGRDPQNDPSRGTSMTPIQFVRRGINSALINTGNLFGQDFSGSGVGMGELYARPDYKQNR